MKKLLLTSAIVLASASAQAAIVTATVNGQLDELTTASGFSGHALADVYGFTPDFAIDVTGSITYDDMTGAVSALTLTQVGSASGSHFNAETVTLSGLGWVYDAGTNDLNQAGPATAVCVDTAAPACSPFGLFAHAIIASNGSATSASILDFTGIPADFLNQGVAPFTLVNPTAALTTEFIFTGSDLQIRVGTVGAQGTTPADLSGVGGNFSLTLTPVPVPAAAWLFGSALLGLASVARRRS